MSNIRSYSSKKTKFILPPDPQRPVPATIFYTTRPALKHNHRSTLNTVFQVLFFCQPRDKPTVFHHHCINKNRPTGFRAVARNHAQRHWSPHCHGFGRLPIRNHKTDGPTWRVDSETKRRRRARWPRAKRPTDLEGRKLAGNWHLKPVFGRVYT